MLELVVIILYACCLVFILVFGVGQLSLLIAYLNSKKTGSAPPPLTGFPQVTIQLPVYNEPYVIRRLINAIASLDYPKTKLQIQVLDDSTDDTTAICRNLIAGLQQTGLDIVHCRRTHRRGYKAGALQDALPEARGEFIAIFDADFLPPPDFLLKTLPHFTTTDTGLVQTRWGHLNPDQSWLTKAQELGLNAHFIIDQQGRDKSNLFLNFNGTAGIWRKSCITDAGGWQSDTLTEDLDLSYRAQIRGWKFRYCPTIVTPAQLPFMLNAIRSQQYRWIKGGVQTSKKLVFNLWRAQLPLTVKLFGTLHLFSNYTYLFILLTALLSVPVLFIKNLNPSFGLFFHINVLFSAVFVINFAYCFTAVLADRKKLVLALAEIAKAFPVTVMISMGMSFHNSKAILSGLAGRKSPFVRTPKFASVNNENKVVAGLPGTGSFVAELPEIVLFVYFLFAVAAGVYFADAGFILYHLLMLGGYGSVLWFGLREVGKT